MQRSTLVLSFDMRDTSPQHLQVLVCVLLHVNCCLAVPKHVTCHIDVKQEGGFDVGTDLCNHNDCQIDLVAEVLERVCAMNWRKFPPNLLSSGVVCQRLID